MTQALGQALEQALAFHRAPGMLSAAHRRPLPDNIGTLLRLAGGDQAMASQLAKTSGESPAELVAAAVFFIQQVMFANGSDSYRVLGVNPDAPDARIKEHYRWLVRWLHPDRNTDEWDSVYADRVNAAWQRLRLPDRRRDYDQSLASGGLGSEFPDAGDHAMEHGRSRGVVRHDLPEPTLLSAATVQRLPVIVLGGLGAVAVTLLLLMWMGAERDAAPPATLATAELPAEARAAVPSAPRDAVPPPAAPTNPDVPATVAPPEAETVATVADVPPPVDLVALDAPASPPPAEPTLVRAEPVATQEPRRPEPAPRAEPPVVAQSTPAPPPRPTRAPATVEAPANVAPPAMPTAPPLPGAMTEAQAYDLISRFSQAYRRGDINGLMQLFASDARNNRGGRDAIVYDYQSLFSSTQARDLTMVPSGWMPRDAGATVLANYEASVQLRGRPRSETTRGEIRFDFRIEDGEPRISRVRHDAGN